MNYNFIFGNECLIRALEIIEKSSQSILMIGSPDSQGEEIVEKLKDKMDIKFWLPCPCGYNEHPTKPCTCSITEIKKHLKTKPKAEMEVMLVPLRWTKIAQDYKEIKELDEQSKDLLRNAVDKMNLDYKEMKSVLKTADTIRELAKETKIQKDHIAEALQYRTKFV